MRFRVGLREGTPRISTKHGISFDEASKLLAGGGTVWRSSNKRSLGRRGSVCRYPGRLALGIIVVVFTDHDDETIRINKRLVRRQEGRGEDMKRGRSEPLTDDIPELTARDFRRVESLRKQRERIPPRSDRRWRRHKPAPTVASFGLTQQQFRGGSRDQRPHPA